MLRMITILWLSLLASTAQAEIAIQQVTSDGGINAWVVEEPGIPFVAVEIRFRGGASLDLPGKRGATNLMAALLEEGAADRDAQAFQTCQPCRYSQSSAGDSYRLCQIRTLGEIVLKGIYYLAGAAKQQMLIVKVRFHAQLLVNPYELTIALQAFGE